MGNLIKKNWFVVLVVVIFTTISIYYIYDTNKGKLKGKSDNGKAVVYEVNNENVTADQFYEDMYSSTGISTIVSNMKKAVGNQCVATTDEMKSTATAQADSIKSQYQSNYGTGYESYLADDLAATGYTDLEEYLIDVQKLDSVTADYAKAHFDDLKIRQISYILIKYDDSNNPTEEPTEAEKKKMDEVDKMMKDGSTFAETAIKYSEDSSTAPEGGNLGVIDKNTSSLDSAFFEASMKLNEGEVSDWVKSDSFGYFRIMCTASTAETLEKNNTEINPYVQLVEQYDSTLEDTAVWEKAVELGIDFHGNTELESKIKEAFGVASEEGE